MSDTESLRAVLYKLRRAINPKAVRFYLPWCSTRKALKTYQECEGAIVAALERLEASDSALAKAIRDWVISMIDQGYRTADDIQPFVPYVPRHVLDRALADPFVAALAREETPHD